MRNNNEFINVLVQAFYGNRVGTNIKPEEIDSFVLGYTSPRYMSGNEKIDRTIIKLPSDGLVLIYNKHEEKRRLEQKKEAFKEDGYVFKPLAYIPEKNIEIYSRCIVCRMDDNGNLKGLNMKDYEEAYKYLAE